MKYPNYLFEYIEDNKRLRAELTELKLWLDDNDDSFVSELHEARAETSRLRIDHATAYANTVALAQECARLRAELAAEQENARGWQNDYDHEAKAGNAIYANETRDWSTTMKSLTYKEIEARLDAVIALCDPDGPDVIWDEDLTVAYVLADAARAAATGVES